MEFEKLATNEALNIEAADPTNGKEKKHRERMNIF